MRYGNNLRKDRKQFLSNRVYINTHLLILGAIVNLAYSCFCVLGGAGSSLAQTNSLKMGQQNISTYVALV